MIVTEGTTAPLKGVITLGELRQRACFRDLTEKQRLLVEAFIASGDKILAVAASHDITSIESARVLSYRAFSAPGVIEALNSFFGVSEHQALRQAVDRALRKKHLSVAEISALRLKCELTGLKPEDLNVPRINGYVPINARPKPCAVGDEISQGGTKFRVTKVDVTGKVVAAEEIS